VGEAALLGSAALGQAAVAIFAGLSADGDPTNEVKPVYDALSVDGDPTNELSTGSTTVYRYVENGVTRYVGITNDFARRASEHLSARGWSIEALPRLDLLSRCDARAVEQVLIEQYGISNLYNRINSIAQANPWYQEAVLRGSEILSRVGYPR